MVKEPHVWIYEYRDDEHPVGATLFEGFASEITDGLQFPHLSSEWHWQMEVTMKERGDDDDF